MLYIIPKDLFETSYQRDMQDFSYQPQWDSHGLTSRQRSLINKILRFKADCPHLENYNGEFGNPKNTGFRVALSFTHLVTAG